jgi:hypothetical protein
MEHATLSGASCAKQPPDLIPKEVRRLMARRRRRISVLMVRPCPGADVPSTATTVASDRITDRVPGIGEARRPGLM